MPEKTDYELMAANLLKAELKRKGVTYAQLVEKLAAIGVDEKEVNVRNKLSRGKFTAAFFLQCLKRSAMRHCIFSRLHCRHRRVLVWIAMLVRSQMDRDRYSEQAAEREQRYSQIALAACAPLPTPDREVCIQTPLLPNAISSARYDLHAQIRCESRVLDVRCRRLQAMFGSLALLRRSNSGQDEKLSVGKPRSSVPPLRSANQTVQGQHLRRFEA